MKIRTEDAGKDDDEAKPKSVGCPCCKNKRLFDYNPETVGEIEIKCQRCGMLIRVMMYAKKVRTEQIGV